MDLGAVRRETEARSERTTDDSGGHRHSRLLAAKLEPPALPPAHVPRPDLCAALAQGGARLTLLSGPPGAGKTTLLSEWLPDHHQRPGCLLSTGSLGPPPV